MFKKGYIFPMTLSPKFTPLESEFRFSDQKFPALQQEHMGRICSSEKT